MKSFKEFLEDDEWEEAYSDILTISILGRTTGSDQLLLESAYEHIEEGQWGPTKKGHEIRLDKRPENQGGDQLHIRKKNQQWALPTQREGKRAE